MMWSHHQVTERVVMARSRRTKYRQVFPRILALIFLIVQGAVLDVHFITEMKTPWRFTWITTDVIVLSTWMYTMWMSTERKSRSVKTAVTEDGTKFAYIAWIVYALHLVPQVATLFRLVTPVYNDKKEVFGPNVIKMNLCLTPMLFLFLIYAHQGARSHSRRKYYLDKITSAVTLDLFDSVEMLQYLFEKEKITRAWKCYFGVFLLEYISADTCLVWAQIEQVSRKRRGSSNLV